MGRSTAIQCIFKDGLIKARAQQKIQFKEQGNDQESLESNTTSDLGHNMGKRKKHTQGNIINKRAKRSAYSPAGDHKAARKRQESMTSAHRTLRPACACAHSDQSIRR